MILNVKKLDRSFVEKNFKELWHYLSLSMSQEGVYSKIKEGEFFVKTEVSSSFIESGTVSFVENICIDGEAYLKYMIPAATKKKKEALLVEEYETYISGFCKISNKKFRGDAASRRAFNSAFKKYGMKDLLKAVALAYDKDDYCRDNGYLTPEFMLRDNKIEKYLNLEVKHRPDSIFSGN